VVEGESDCHTLWHCGIPALGLPGASIWREERDSVHLEGISRILVVAEPDMGGETVLNWISTSVIRDRVWIVSLGVFKDPSALYISDPQGFRANWEEKVKSAFPWAEVEKIRRMQQRRALWEACKDLATSPDILGRLMEVMEQSGIAGERRLIKLIYLCLTSRMLPKIVSIVIKGPSSTGKSFLPEKVLELFPESAYHRLTGMSERALAYSSEPLKNRFIVVFEAIGMEGTFQSYLIRSLLSEGCISYETVEKTPLGLRARHIEREGPTGLLTTTTAGYLHPENETRLVSVAADDSSEQTKRILLEQAREDLPVVDLAPWIALQQWLEGEVHGVTIPYASYLAHYIPPVAVRLRRDFPTLLALIKAHAILHQVNRGRNGDGEIIASNEDYASVCALVRD
ncbi:MAG: hypothetical protein FJY85_20485, partial [Deltaproteobacteria bacterium]|nr:hypothetical protein [Deltaproteobacteria bacterium]